MNSFYHFDPKLLTLARQAEEACAQQFAQIDAVCEHNTAKVLHAFSKNHISESHFAASTGYGYGDRGREALDSVLADIFGCEDALIRHNFVSGTHAITTALFGVLRPGDEMVAVTGQPYDTLHGALGLTGRGYGSQKEFESGYRQLDLLPDGSVDLENLPSAVQGAKVVYIQRSRGYTLRPSLTMETLKKVISTARAASPNPIIMVETAMESLSRSRSLLRRGRISSSAPLLKILEAASLPLEDTLPANRNMWSWQLIGSPPPEWARR